MNVNSLLVVATLDWGDADIPLSETEREELATAVTLALADVLGGIVAVRPEIMLPHLAVALGETVTPGEMVARLREIT